MTISSQEEQKGRQDAQKGAQDIKEERQNKHRVVISVTRDSLPASCPPKGQEHWNQHPRVYLELEKSGEANCPYCGNHFELSDD